MQSAGARAGARDAFAFAFAILIAGSGSTASFGQTRSVVPETVVIATRIPTPMDRIGNAVTVITGEEIRARQATSVTDVLRMAPGLAVSRTGAGPGAQTQVRIRGAEANQTLVLVDGIEVNDPSGESQFDFGHLLAAGVERIEILRGPQSTLYGSDAVGGVINIITRRGEGEPTGYVSLEGGSFRTGRADAGVSGSLDQLSYALYATGYRSDGISIASRKRGFDESDGYDQQVIGGRIGLTPTETLQFDLVGRWTQARVETDGFSDTTSPNMTVDANDDTLYWQRIGRAQATLDTFGGTWQHVVGASIADTRRDFRSDDVETSTFDGLRRKFDYQSNLFYSTDALAPAEHATVIGLERETERAVSTSAFADIDRELETTSVFAQQGVTLWDALTVTAAGRRDWNELFEDETTWRLSGAYTFRDTGLKLKASYGTAVKAPTIFELFGFTQNFQGNPDLVPERARGFDVGIELPLPDGRGVVEAVYFSNRIDNLIAGFGNTARNLSGESRSHGVELSGHYAPIESLDLTASYTYTDTRDAEGNELVRRPQHVASFTGTWRFLEGRAQATLGVDYNGNATDLVFFPFPEPSRRVLIGGYTLMRLAGSYELTDRLQLFGRIENALNEQYEEVFSFATPGRAAYVGLRATF